MKNPVKVLVDHNDGGADHIVADLITYSDNEDYAIIDVSRCTDYRNLSVTDSRLESTLEFSKIAVDTFKIYPPNWYVTVYEIDRCYGGPEEGGWWYDSGRVVHETFCGSDDQGFWTANIVAENLRKEFPFNNSYTSCAYSGGDYTIRIRNTPGENFPKETPYYC